MKLQSFIAFLLLYSSSFGQSQKKIDSLENLLNNAKSDTCRLSIISLLTKQLGQTGNYEKAFQYVNETKKITEKFLSQSSTEGNDTALFNFMNHALATAYNNKGIMLMMKGSFSEALENYENSSLIFEKMNDKKGLAFNYNNIGIVHKKQGNYHLAIKDYLKASEIFKEIGDKKSLGGTFHNVGNIQIHLGNFPDALKSHLQSLKVKEEIGDKYDIGASYLSVAIILKHQQNYSEALKYSIKSMEIRKEIEDKDGAANTGLVIGEIYQQMKNFNEAIKYFQISLKISEELEDSAGIEKALSNIGDIYFYQNNFDEALKYDKRVLKISEKIGDMSQFASTNINIADVYTMQKNYPAARIHFMKGLNLSLESGEKTSVKDCYNGLGELSALEKDFKNAYKFYLLYSTYKDSLYNEAGTKEITEMQTKFETEKKELQIENLNKDNAFKESEIKKQNLQKIAYGSGLILTLLLSMVIFRGYKQKKTANQIISAQKGEVENQKFLVEEKNKNLEIAYLNIEEKNHEIMDSIRYAKRIQEAILPPKKIVKEYLEKSFILYKPKDIVAGDFYWMTPLPSKKGNPQIPVAGKEIGKPTPAGDGASVLFAACDCTGHGVPGAFMSILGHNGLNCCVKDFGLSKPAAILDKLCELIDEGFSKSEIAINDGMDIALCSLEFNGPSGIHSMPPGDKPVLAILNYAGAGNSLYHIRGNCLTEFKADKQPIGKYSYRKPFTNHIIELQKDDSFYIFTDGFADQFGGPKGKKFKYSQFEKILVTIATEPMEKQREILNETIESWKGELEQIDDICVIGVKI